MTAARRSWRSGHIDLGSANDGQELAIFGRCLGAWCQDSIHLGLVVRAVCPKAGKLSQLVRGKLLELLAIMFREEMRADVTT